MNFTQAIKSVFSNYANFNGRSRRSEYWWFFLFSFIISIILQYIDTGGHPFSLEDDAAVFQLGTLGTIYSLATLLPGLGVAVRRLHDVGKSGWFLFIVLIPFIGAIWLIVLFCTDSEPDDNEYGPNPKIGISRGDIDAIGNNP
jgi:uncharacterized membrane protein YhaH (DUF805 family)